jgi:hypothetical protein
MVSVPAPRAVLVALALGAAVAAADRPPSDLQPELHDLLVNHLKFSAGEISDLQYGKVVRHALPPTSAGEVAAVGGVRIHAKKAQFVAAYRDIVHFKRNASVLEIGRFSNPPEPADLDALTLTKEDFELRECRVGRCDIRLSAEGIRRFAAEVDWSHADADAQAAALFKRMLLDNVRAYAAGGPGRITEYDDEPEPVRPVEDFHAVLKSSPYVDAALPGLGAHLASYQADPLPDAEDFLYWSKEKFGIAPFISVTHVTIAPQGVHQYVAATRDVYSTRYFDASLSLAVASDSVHDPDAFYLFYVNRSRASALRGAFARIRRSIVERRAKGSIDENLRDVKARLETRP